MQGAAEGAVSARAQVNAILAQYAHIVADLRSPLFSLRHKTDGLGKKEAYKQMRRLFQAILEPLDCPRCVG